MTRFSGGKGQLVAEVELGYYANTRSDVLAHLSGSVGRVLDVGCGTGAASASLRDQGATELVGVEISSDAAAKASDVLDQVIESSVEEALVAELGTFDTILCLDVLEHLVDADTVLAQLHGIANPGATLLVSVPNARHYSLAQDLLLRGTFAYADWGHRDRTHLRWFTPRDIQEAVHRSGWTVDLVAWPKLGRSRTLHRITGGRSSQFLVAQVYVKASRRD